VPVGRAADTAADHAGQSIIALRARGLSIGGSALSYLGLHGVEGGAVDDGGMVVFDQEHGKLAGVNDFLLRKVILDKSLLEQQIPGELFIAQYLPQVFLVK